MTNFWVTGTGEKILISDMGNSHLLNIYHYLKRQSFISKNTYNKIVNCRDFLSEEQFNFVLSRPISKSLSFIEKELKNRNIPF